MPAWLAEPCIVLVVAALATGLHYAIQRSISFERLRKHNDVAGFMLSVVGVIYAVVLGFVVILALQKFDAAIANTNSEVAAVSDLYRVVAPFPGPLRRSIRTQLHRYVDEMINEEWPAMARGRELVGDLDILENVAGSVDTFNPGTRVEEDAHVAAMAQVQRLFDARRLRLVETQPSIPAVLWFALIAGAAAVLGFAYLFGVEDRAPQLVMTAILAGVIAIMFIVIYEFDYPFGGSAAVSPTGWLYLQERLIHIH